MKHRDIENRLALLGAIIVLIGVSSAATTALASESAAPERAVASEEIARVTLEGGRRANRRSVDAALEAIKLDNGSGLDIELASRTSTLVREVS